MVKLLAKSVLTVIGLTLSLFCFALAWVGSRRLYGWSQTGRFVPPHYPELERHDLISFSAEPVRAALEIAGSLFLVTVGVCGIFAIAMTFRNALIWTRNLPAILPLAFVLIFVATVAGVFVGHVDWILPASIVLGSIEVGIVWIDLRKKGLPLTAKVSDVQIASQRKQSALSRRSGRAELIMGAALLLLGIMKFVSLFSHWRR